MKLTKLIFLFVLSVAAVSCSKNDDDNGPAPYTLSTSNFVDTYKLKFLELRIVETITFGNGTTSTSSAVTVGSVFQNTNFVFNSNNTYTVSGSINTVTTTTNPDGSQTVGDIVIVNLEDTGTYSLNTTSNKLTITNDEGTVTVFDIKKYNETEMTLYSEVTTVSNNSSVVTSSELRFSR